MTDRLTVSVHWTRGLRRAVTITIVALLGASPTLRVRSTAAPAAPPPRAPELRLWVDGEEHTPPGAAELERLWSWLAAVAPGVHSVVVQRCDAPGECRVTRALVETAR